MPTNRPALLTTSRQVFWFFALLFFFSGVAGLMYEVLWVRELQYLFGSTTYSISAILTSFFGGMGLGSYVMGRLGKDKNPLGLYALMELGIGLYALLTPFLFDFIYTLYLSTITTVRGDAQVVTSLSLLDASFKCLLAFVVLGIPCSLMGGTLPVLSRLVKSSNIQLGSDVGKLYGINTLGAMVGVGLTGFLLMEKLGLSGTRWAAVGINLGGSLLAFLCYLATRNNLQVIDGMAKKTASVAWTPLLAYSVSGFCALGYEVIWTRGIIQTLSSSVYTFVIVLLLYLFGLAVGSLLGSWIWRRVGTHRLNAQARPVIVFSAMQLVLGLAILGSVLLYEGEWSLETVAAIGWRQNLLAMGVKTALLILLPTLILGSLFPLVVDWCASLKRPEDDLGSIVGPVYSANTIGSIVGSFSAGFIGIPLLGVWNTLLLLVGINTLIAVVLVGRLWLEKTIRKPLLFGSLGGATALMILAFVMPRGFEPPTPPDFKRIFYKEEAVANVSIFHNILPERDFKVLKINSIYQSGGTDAEAMRVQRRQGHLPMLLHPAPDSVLMIGLATGVTLSAIAEHPARHLTAVEIVPSQVEAARLLAEENQHVLDDPRLQLVIDDGRSFLQTTSQRFDLIVGDLFQVESAGTGNLYAVEHFETCRRRLRPGGMMVQWLPLQQMNEDHFRIILKSMAQVFPHIQLWMGDPAVLKPVVALVATMEPSPVHYEEIRQRIASRQTPTLESVGYTSPLFVVSQWFLAEENLLKMADGVPLNTYDHPIIEYTAPKMNPNDRERRTRQMLAGWVELKRPLPVVFTEGTVGVDSLSVTPAQQFAAYSEATRYTLLAEMAGSLNQWTQAEALLEEILPYAPDHADARRVLGRAKVFVAVELMRQGQIPPALEKLDMALQLGVQDVMVYQLQEAGRKALQDMP